jgi:hypothetical protein
VRGLDPWVGGEWVAYAHAQLCFLFSRIAETRGSVIYIYIYGEVELRGIESMREGEVPRPALPRAGGQGVDYVRRLVCVPLYDMLRPGGLEAP